MSALDDGAPPAVRRELADAALLPLLEHLHGGHPVHHSGKAAGSFSTVKTRSIGASTHHVVRNSSRAIVQALLPAHRPVEHGEHDVAGQDRLVAERNARRGHGSLLDVLDELPAPIVGPPTEETLKDLRAERA